MVPVESTDKFEIIRELVDRLHAQGRLGDREGVLRAVISREEVRSTGIGHGLAIPHAKTDSCPRMSLAIGKPRHPVDFNSADKCPVDLVVLLTGPATVPADHIQALARISRIWLNQGFREEVRAAETPQQLFEALARFDQGRG